MLTQSNTRGIYTSVYIWWDLIFRSSSVAVPLVLYFERNVCDSVETSRDDLCIVSPQRWCFDGWCRYWGWKTTRWKKLVSVLTRPWADGRCIWISIQTALSMRRFTCFFFFLSSSSSSSLSISFFFLFILLLFFILPQPKGSFPGRSGCRQSNRY